MPDQDPIIIVGPDGTEHEFPAGMDPKRAAAIVRGQSGGPAPARPDDELWKLDPGHQVAIGALKGVGSTVVGLGRLVSKIPGVSGGISGLYDMLGLSGVDPEAAFSGDTEGQLGLTPSNTGQRIGKFLEQTAEYAVPSGTVSRAVGSAVRHAPRVVRGLSKIGGQAAVGAGVSEARDTDPVAGAVIGGIGPVVGGAMQKGAEVVGSKAIPLARTGLKTAVRVLKGERATKETLNDTSRKIAKFIVDRNLATPEQAENVISGAEREVQSVLRRSGQTPSDAALRADRYLSALERRYQGKGLGEDQIASVRSARAELKRMKLGEDVPTTVMQPSPILNAQGQPILTPTTVMTRELRKTVPTEEALRIGRMQGKGEGVRNFSEQQGASTEASKKVELAVRNAAKTAVPALRAPLELESEAIPAKQVLDLMSVRTGNRDLMSLPGTLATAAELGGGKVPVIGLISQWLRNNQLRAGRWAGSLQRAIDAGDVSSAVRIMEQIGSGSGTALLQRQALIDQMRQD